jgi:hypothetical protein
MIVHTNHIHSFDVVSIFQPGRILRMMGARDLFLNEGHGK